MTDFATRRRQMVEQQIRARGIDDPRLLEAFAVVPREAFLDPAFADSAYRDGPLPIGCGQTISQPYIVALTIATADIGPGDVVLEVGAGSGYAAAILSRVARNVVSIERHADLAIAAAERVERLGYTNVQIVSGDGSLGYPGAAPFDAIVAAASGSHIPRPLVDQLRVGGRIVMPVGAPGAAQQLMRAMKARDGSLDTEQVCAVRFVPLIGAEGHSDPDAERGNG